MLGEEFSPSFEISRLRLGQRHGLVLTDFPPKHFFDVVLGERAELPCVRFEPDIRLLVGAAHPVR